MQKIDIKDGKDSRRGQWVCCTDNPYNPQKESYRWVSVADLMSLKNILENYKYHTMKEIEDIINDSMDVFEISNRSEVLLEIEDGIEMIDDCLHPEDSEKAEEDGSYTTSNDGEDTEKKDDVMDMIKDIVDKICENEIKVQGPETMFANPELVKRYQAYMARNIFTNADGDKDDN